MSVKPAEAEIVKFIFERYLQGISYRKIAGEVEAKFHKSLHPSTIAYILRNEAYIGIRIWNKRQKDGSIRPKSDWVVKEQSHTAIIEKTFSSKSKSFSNKGLSLKASTFCRDFASA